MSRGLNDAGSGGVRSRNRADEAALPHRVGAIALIASASFFECRRSRGATAFVMRIAEVIAVLHERDAAVVGDHLQAVPAEFEVPEDLRALQAADVGAVGVRAVRVQLAADRGAADVGFALHDQHLEPALARNAALVRPL